MNIRQPNLPYLLMGYSVVMGIREMFTNWRRVMISIVITTEYFITEKERADSGNNERERNIPKGFNLFVFFRRICDYFNQQKLYDLSLPAMHTSILSFSSLLSPFVSLFYFYSIINIILLQLILLQHFSFILISLLFINNTTGRKVNVVDTKIK